MSSKQYYSSIFVDIFGKPSVPARFRSDFCHKERVHVSVSDLHITLFDAMSTASVCFDICLSTDKNG